MALWIQNITPGGVVLEARPTSTPGLSGNPGILNGEVVAWREKVAAILRNRIYIQRIDDDCRVVGYEDATDAILQALAVIPQGEGGRSTSPITEGGAASGVSQRPAPDTVSTDEQVGIAAGDEPKTPANGDSQ